MQGAALLSEQPRRPIVYVLPALAVNFLAFAAEVDVLLRHRTPLMEIPSNADVPGLCLRGALRKRDQESVVVDALLRSQ
jgi:hypothetical protein